MATQLPTTAMVYMDDADSVFAWLSIYPRRHAAQLRVIAKLRPQWAPAINAALDRARAIRDAATAAQQGDAA